jgi:cell division protein FtsB
MNKFINKIKDLSRKIGVKNVPVNKYYITILVFLVVTFCIGDSTLKKRYAYNQEINRLQNEIEYYKKQKEENTEKLYSLKSDNESLEKYAREQFHMTKPDEDLFIITP